MVSLRFTDNKAALAANEDFVIRKRLPTLGQFGIIFLSALLIAISLAIAVNSKPMLITIIIILLGTLGWYVAVQTQRNRDLLLATEFQNALFASALGLNHKFCLIIKKDGTIVYIDRSFQELFPDFMRQSHHSIDTLLEQGGLSRLDSEKVFSAIAHGVYEKVIFDLHGPDNSSHKMVMSIEPILRPRGFILLRGREYVERRKVTSALPDEPLTGDLLSKPTITLFSHVMDTMQVGVYMCGPGGEIIYANTVFEHWLGYSEGELTSKTVTLQELIQQNSKAIRIGAGDYEGETWLQRKNNGEPMRAFVNQKIIRDEHDKVLGCTALVHPFTGTTTETRKKLW